MLFIRLNQQEAMHLWPKAKPFLTRFARRREEVYTVEDLHEAVEAGEAQLWCTFDNEEMLGAAVTSVDSASKGRKVNVIEIGGTRLKDWASLMEDELTAFARANNCGTIEAITRPGFGRLIPSFKPHYDAVLHIKRVHDARN